jgi:hypothetical protein
MVRPHVTRKPNEARHFRPTAGHPAGGNSEHIFVTTHKSVEQAVSQGASVCPVHFGADVN